MSNTKRIAKNTIFLYVRSVIIMVLTIFTSRVLLSTLGVENYGVYNVVGGVVAMFTSIKSVLAASVQRFLNFYKGKGEVEYVRSIFNTSIIIHIALAVIFAIVVEIVGMWFIENHLVIPHGSLDDALFVFQCSLISVLITIITIPYDAAVIANEHMNFYAYISIGDAALKLLVILIIPLLPFEYLRTYSIMVLFITVALKIASVIYCKRFDECRLVRVFDIGLFKDISSFAGWNFLGCTASSLIEEGSNFVLNAFGGVVANAARGIAYQVRSAINLISSNVVVASQPLIMQKAGIVEEKRFFEYIFIQTRILFYIISITCLPIFCYCENILTLWLGEVPQYTLEFTRAILIYMVVMSFQKSLDIAFKSYGFMAKYQIIDTIFTMLTLPITYFVLRAGYPLHYAFYSFSIVRVVDYIAILLLAKYQINLPTIDYIKHVVLKCCYALIIAIVMGMIFSSFLKCNNIFTLILYSGSLVVLTALLYYLLVFTNQEKQIIKNLSSKIKK